jgi:hypothetical protein
VAEADRLIANLEQGASDFDDIAASSSRLWVMFCWTAAMPRPDSRK